MQGMANPFFGAASGLAAQSASPISGSQVANYLNPYANSVLGNLNEVFGQQQRNTTGQLQQAAGGIGANRIALGQGELARQQGLAAGQTMSGIYQNALQAAQQDAQRQQGASYLFANMGPAAQNTALQGNQALLQAGGQQQQLGQSMLNSLYGQQQAQFAYPFQTPQYLAGITGGLAPAMGGTTTGQSQTQYPAPSALSQIAGGLTGALGLAGSMGGIPGLGSMGGKGAKGAGAGAGLGVGYTPAFGPPIFGPGMRRGGPVYRAEGGEIDSPLRNKRIGTNPFKGSLVPDTDLNVGSVHYPQIDLRHTPLPQDGGGGGGGSGSTGGGKGSSSELGRDLKLGADVGSAAMKFLPMLALYRGGRLASGGAVGPYTAYQGYDEGGEVPPGYSSMAAYLSYKRATGDYDAPDDTVGFGHTPKRAIGGQSPPPQDWRSYIQPQMDALQQSMPQGMQGQPMPDQSGGGGMMPAMYQQIMQALQQRQPMQQQQQMGGVDPSLIQGIPLQQPTANAPIQSSVQAPPTPPPSPDVTEPPQIEGFTAQPLYGDNKIPQYSGGALDNRGPITGYRYVKSPGQDYNNVGARHGGRIPRRAEGGFNEDRFSAYIPDIPFSDRFDPTYEGFGYSPKNSEKIPEAIPLSELSDREGRSVKGALREAPIVDATNLGLGKDPNWGPGQTDAPQRVMAGAKREDIDAVEGPGPARVTIPAQYAEGPSPGRRATVSDAGPARSRVETDYPGPYRMPREEMPYPDSLKRNLGEQMSRSPWLALARAGFATMGGTSPYAGVNIGRGGVEGIKQLEEQRGALMKEEEVNQRAQGLWQQAQQHADQYKYLTAGQKIQEDKDAYFPPVATWDGSGFIMMPKKPGMQPRYFKQGPDGNLVESPGGVGAGAAGASPTGTPPPTPPAIPAPPTQAPQSTSPAAPLGGRDVATPPAEMINPPNVAERNPSLGIQYGDPKNRSRGIAASDIERKKLDADSDTANVTEQRATQIGRNLDVVTNWTRSLDPKNVQNANLIKTLFDPGADGDKRLEAITRYNTYAKNTGLPQVPQEVMASMVAMQKDSVLGGFRNITAEGLSAREAQPIIRAAMGVMPGMNTPEVASRLLVSGMQQTAQLARDKRAFFEDYRRKNGGFSDGWRTEFEKTHPPDLYAARTVVNVLPQEAKAALPANVQALRQARDIMIAAEKSGDQKAVAEARQKFEMGKANFDRKFGNLGNYFMFGKF